VLTVGDGHGADGEKTQKKVTVDDAVKVAKEEEKKKKKKAIAEVVVEDEMRRKSFGNFRRLHRCFSSANRTHCGECAPG
jgi:hypothetical protein